MIGQASEDVLILAIESSCDETAAAVVKNGRTVLSNVISSQIATHTVYGGVVPEIASREHIKAINYVIERALSEANVTLEDITAIGVTYGPGLVGALLVGVAEAKAIAYASHLALDMLNYRRLQLIWPMKRGFSLKLCSSQGLINHLLLSAGMVCVVLELVTSIPARGLAARIVSFLPF